MPSLHTALHDDDAGYMINLPHEVSVLIVLVCMFALPTAVLIVGAIRTHKEKRSGR